MGIPRSLADMPTAAARGKATEVEETFCNSCKSFPAPARGSVREAAGPGRARPAECGGGQGVREPRRSPR